MGMKFEYEGIIYDVPCMPKKEWGEWMTDIDHVCFRSMEDACYTDGCKKCIYASYQEDNAKVRKAFYYECFPEEKPVEKPVEKPSCEECANYKPKEETKKLPKLTQEVFVREDCPKWAKWAAVDKNGKGYWHDIRPVAGTAGWYTRIGRVKHIENIAFDTSNWEHSLIEKEIRYVSCSSLKWPTLFKYSKLKDTYYCQKYEWDGPEWYVAGTTTVVDKVPYDAIDVIPEFKDPAAVVGTKVKLINPGHYEKDQVFMIIQAGHRNAKLSSTGMDYGLDAFARAFVKLDGSLICTFKEV